MKKSFIALIIVCILGINAYVNFTTQPASYYQNSVPIAQAPEGQKYIPYCDGGLSLELVDEQDDGCIADYPGAFARIITLIASFILIFIRLGFYIVKENSKNELAEK